MKNKLYPLTIILLATAAFSLSSCLKESPYYVNLSNSKPLVELPEAAYLGIGGTPVSENLADSSTFDCIVNVASPQLLTTSTSVVLEVDPTFSSASVLAAFNTTNGTNCVLLPTADYSVPSLTVTIPPGEPHDAPLKITVNTGALSGGVSYLLPIEIKSAPYTIDQYNEVFYVITVPGG